MNAYYSIVSISSSSHLNERFNIGLLCAEGERAFFHYSKAKLNIVGRLFSKSAKDLAQSTLNSIDKSVNQTNKKNHFNAIFDSSQNRNILSADYLNYLNRYNNNLIQFSAPTKIDLKINNEIFQKLFRKYIFEQEIFELVETKVESRFGKEYPEFLNRASKYVNTNYQVTRELIPSLITPKKVDMIGKNGSFNLAHSIDFGISIQTLNHHLDSYMYLALSSELAEDKHAKCFIIGEEPAKSSKNHEIWQSVRKLTTVDYVAFDEREIIIEHFKRSGVEPIK
jgi:hypothetical protein